MARLIREEHGARMAARRARREAEREAALERRRREPRFTSAGQAIALPAFPFRWGPSPFRSRWQPGETPR